jgi:hypothetical protein
MKEWHAWIGTKTESQANALVEMLSVAYMLPPMYDAEAADPESAKNYWINNLREKTDTELGVIYNSKGTIKPFF